MERGQLGIENRTATVFVFEGLVAHLRSPQIEKWLVRAHKWESAFECWELDLQVCEYMSALTWRYNTPVQILTWRHPAFVPLIEDRLGALNVPLDQVSFNYYHVASAHIATDPTINTVYDPEHPHGSYGYKAREFHL
jgi:hypothetical protein